MILKNSFRNDLCQPFKASVYCVTLGIYNEFRTTSMKPSLRVPTISFLMQKQEFKNLQLENSQYISYAISCGHIMCIYYRAGMM